MSNCSSQEFFCARGRTRVSEWRVWYTHIWYAHGKGDKNSLGKVCIRTRCELGLALGVCQVIPSCSTVEKEHHTCMGTSSHDSTPCLAEIMQLTRYSAHWTFLLHFAMLQNRLGKLCWANQKHLSIMLE